jgi:hypothetical protein
MSYFHTVDAQTIFTEVKHPRAGEDGHRIQVTAIMIDTPYPFGRRYLVMEHVEDFVTEDCVYKHSAVLEGINPAEAIRQAIQRFDELASLFSGPIGVQEDSEMLHHNAPVSL